MTGPKVDWIDQAATHWLAIENVNVIKVSWAAGNRYLYEKAASGTPIVAREITILLHHLAGMNGIEFTQPEFAGRIQIVGHSLGAHIAAFVGQDLGGTIGRITGLDPAGVFFDKQPREQRLDPTDARLVDVIHTNGGKLHYANLAASSVPAVMDWVMSKVPGLNRLHSKIKDTMGEGYNREADTSWFGIDQQVGHVDYYANDGRVQPECESYLHICDHGRSSQIYNDILEHERQFLAQFGPEQRKQNRILTFEAPDYDSFFVGASLASNCGPILDVSPQHRRNLRESVRKCSLPMDFISPVDELIQEFSLKYGLKSLGSSTGGGQLSDAKYYFSTRGQHPLVGNHFILKVNTRAMSNWNPKCHIKAELILPNDISTRIELLKDPTKAAGIGGTISALFTAPTSWPLSNSGSTTNSTGGPSEPRVVDWREEAHKFLPKKIKFTVSSVGVTDSTIKAVARNIWNRFSVAKADKSLCNLDVESVEIVPLIGSEQSFAGRYDNRWRERLSASQELELRLDSVQIE